MLKNALDLNNPDTRQSLLAELLEQRKTLVSKEVADEFAVSIDTVRRDLMALESRGVLRRVKGGAIPVAREVKPFSSRVRDGNNWLLNAGDCIKQQLEGVNTLFLDGGTSVMEFAHFLPAGFNGTVITPSPVIATIAVDLEIETLLLGGKIHPSGAIATGSITVNAIQQCYADLCVLGTCGLHSEFGLSAHDIDEATVKAAMANHSSRVLALATEDKLNLRSRHKVVGLEGLDALMTDAGNDSVCCYQQAEIDVYCI